MIRNYLTIHVEDYYQVSAFESFVGHERWHEYTPPSRAQHPLDSCPPLQDTDLKEKTGVPAKQLIAGFKLGRSVTRVLMR